MFCTVTVMDCIAKHCKENNTRLRGLIKRSMLASPSRFCQFRITENGGGSQSQYTEQNTESLYYKHTIHILYDENLFIGEKYT